jgi:hypothetical protein
MNRKVLICVWAFAVLTSASSKAYACSLPPVANLVLGTYYDSVTKKYYMKAGDDIGLGGRGSYDPDGGDPNLTDTKYIKKFYWSFGDGSSYYETPTSYPDGIFNGSTFHTYSTPIVCTPTLTVTDNDAGNDPAERHPPDKSDPCSCSLVVVKVNLNMACVPDDYREENPGGYVPVNDDDDNDNGIADKDEAPVNGEDNLVAIFLSILPANLTTGEVELRVLSDTHTHIQVWKYPDKRELIIPNGDPPKYYKRWAPSQLPPTLYVEGMSPGTEGLMLLYVVDQQVYIHNDLVCITVGCSSAGPHDSSVNWNHTTNYFATPDRWGYFDFWPKASKDVDFRYSTCTWVCEISNVEAFTDVEVWHPNRPGYVSITKASDVPCGDENSEALLAKSDLNDSDLTDDSGADLSKYWIHLAICVHEEKHRTDWINFYGPRLNTAITTAETITVNINCYDVPYTCTCQSAEAYWMDQIVWLFDWAWDSALEQFDDPATQDVDESEVRAYLYENAIEQPVSDALPGGCTP